MSSTTRRLTRSISRSTARRAVAVGTAAGLVGVALVAPAAAAVPAFAAAVSPFATSKASSEAPVTLKATYELDGKKVSRNALVGKSGLLEVTYVVRNTTAQPTEIRYKDGTGKEIVETTDVVTPYVGRLAVTVPDGFRDVTADGAEVLEDGSLGWSLVLFNPVGEPAQQLKWTARVSDAELPPATLQVARVTPTGAKVLSSGVKQAEETAAGSVALTAGVFKIDGSVLKLRDGATELLDGLVQLADGASALRAGLADKAAPGAVKLSEGLGKARQGGAELDAGVGQLAAGAETLSAGLQAADSGGQALAVGLDKLIAGGGRLIAGLDAAAEGGGKLAEGLRSTEGQPDLAGGSAAIAAGLVKVRDGVAALTAEKGLPQAQAGLEKLLFGLDHAPGALGTTDPGGLLQGLSAIASGLSHAPGTAGATDRGGVKEGLAAVLDPSSGLPVARNGVSASLAALRPNVTAADGSINPSHPTTPLNQLSGAATAVGTHLPQVLDGLALACGTASAQAAALGAPLDNTLVTLCAGYTDAATVTSLKTAAGAVKVKVPEVIAGTNASYFGLSSLESGLNSALGGLGLIKAGVDRLAAGSTGAQGAVETQVIPGVEQLIAGLGGAISKIDAELAPGVGQLADGSQTLAEKTALAADGAADLRSGLQQLAAGGGQLADGAGAAAAGADKLSAGLGQLNAGGGKLSDGLGSAKQGTAQLLDGLVQLDTGGASLATGLGDAAEGSGKLEDGIIKVRDGVEAVRDGANELSGRGTSALGGSVNAAAHVNNQKVAMLQAVAARGADSSDQAAFDVVLASADSDSGLDAALLAGGAAAALLVLGGTGFVLHRRRAVEA